MLFVCSRRFILNYLNPKNYSKLPNMPDVEIQIKKYKAGCNLDYDPLIDLPDWCYLDGSIGKMSKRAEKRIHKRLELAKQAQELMIGVDQIKNTMKNLNQILDEHNKQTDCNSFVSKVDMQHPLGRPLPEPLIYRKGRKNYRQ